MSRREDKISAQQKEMLVSFMLDHLNFAQGKLLAAEGRVQHNQLWEELAQILNLLDGPNKNITKWQKVWTDLKNKTKKKAGEIRGSRGRTGGGPATTQKLTDVEEQIISILSKEAIFGIVGPDDIPLDSDICFASTTSKSKGRVYVEPVPSTSEARQFHFEDMAALEEPQVEILSDSSAPSSPSSTSSTQSRRRRGRSTAEKAVENFTYLSGTLNEHVQEIGNTLKAILEEKKKTNLLFQELIDVLKEK